jgi:hypothetical protein
MFKIEMHDYFFVGGLGLGFGVLISCILHFYGITSTSQHHCNIFGIHSSHLVQLLTLFFTMTTIGISAWLSLLIYDNDYPKKFPVLFTIETLLAGFIPASFILCMQLTRKKDINEKFFKHFSLLSIKLILTHIFLQYAGVYTYIFKRQHS